jgi:hypothetical protein
VIVFALLGAIFLLVSVSFVTSLLESKRRQA